MHLKVPKWYHITDIYDPLFYFSGYINPWLNIEILRRVGSFHLAALRLNSQAWISPHPFTAVLHYPGIYYNPMLEGRNWLEIRVLVDS